MEYSDKQLLDMLQGKDVKQRQQAMSYLYLVHQAWLHRYLSRRIEQELVNDLYQEIMTIIFENLVSQAFKENSTIRTYIYGIANRQVLRRYDDKRRAAIHNRQLHYPTATTENPEALYLNKERRDYLQQKLDELLNPRCKEILILWSHHYSFAEIAQLLGYSSATTVRSTKLRCMKQLTHLANEDEILRVLRHL